MENDLQAIRAALRQVPFLANLSARELDSLSGMARPRQYAAGEAIVRQGEGGIGVYLLVSGQVRMLRALASGEVRELDRVGPGAVFGEMALLDEAPRVATVEAVTDSVCLVLPRWEFLALLRANGDLAVALLQDLARRLRHVQELIG